MTNQLHGWMGGPRNVALAGARRTGGGCADRGDSQAVRKIAQEAEGTIVKIINEVAEG